MVSLHLPIPLCGHGNCRRWEEPTAVQTISPRLCPSAVALLFPRGWPGPGWLQLGRGKPAKFFSDPPYRVRLQAVSFISVFVSFALLWAEGSVLSSMRSGILLCSLIHPKSRGYYWAHGAYTVFAELLVSEFPSLVCQKHCSFFFLFGTKNCIVLGRSPPPCP